MNNKTGYEAPQLEQHKDWGLVTAIGGSGAPIPGDLDLTTVPDFLDAPENQ